MMGGREVCNYCYNSKERAELQKEKKKLQEHLRDLVKTRYAESMGQKKNFRQERLRHYHFDARRRIRRLHLDFQLILWAQQGAETEQLEAETEQLEDVVEQMEANPNLPYWFPMLKAKMIELEKLVRNHH